MIADESVNKNLINALRKAGHTVLSIAEESPGISDEKITVASLSPPNIIISEDKDFGELVYHHKVSVIGVILLRYSPSEFETVKHRLLAFILDHETNLQGKFVVITFNKTRIRTLS
jgi:predicted nuclease of predicted toxin-antitoxin system